MLPATLETTQWGWFDNAQPPVLRVNSGDTVVLETMMHSHNQVVPGTTIEQIKKTRTDFPGRGPHTLTGPIYIEEAQPGDVLKVTLNKIVPRAYATNFNVPGMFGQFPNVYQDGQVKYLYLDLEKKTTEFLPGVVIPLRPFPGTLGGRAQGAGPLHQRAAGRVRRQHGHPRLRGGHARSTFRCTCRARCCGPAIRMPARATARSTSPRSRPPTGSSTSRSRSSRASRSTWPRIETRRSWITMGFDQDLNKAWDQAKAETIKFLAEQRNIVAEQAAEADGRRCRIAASRRS